MDYNILIADFAGKNRICMTDTLYQYDYGQKLKIESIPALPQTFEAHFSNVQHGGVSITVTGMDGIVDIPNTLLMTGKRIYCWIYVTEPGSGETVYQILLPVQHRPMPEYYDVTDVGVFDSVVQQVGDYAATATAGATSATASAAAAATSASEAAASASAAETAKTAAETAQGKAEDAQTAAESAAQTATQKAQQTAQDAAQAAQSKADAESAADRAEAAQTGAENAKMDAETAAQGAADSASAASASATSAGQAATSAAQSATAAAGSATTAQGAAQTATTKAGEASASADAAAASETAAQTAQQGAEAAKDTAVANATTATTKAAEAAQSASNAADSETAAKAAATRAETAAASLTVDSALSDTSTNPVQNKVITGEIADVKSALKALEADVFDNATVQPMALDTGITMEGYYLRDAASTDAYLEFRTSTTQNVVYFKPADRTGILKVKSNISNVVSVAVAELENPVIDPTGGTFRVNIENGYTYTILTSTDWIELTIQKGKSVIITYATANVSGLKVEGNFVEQNILLSENIKKQIDIDAESGSILTNYTGNYYYYTDLENGNISNTGTDANQQNSKTLRTVGRIPIRRKGANIYVKRDMTAIPSLSAFTFWFFDENGNGIPNEKNTNVYYNSDITDSIAPPQNAVSFRYRISTTGTDNPDIDPSIAPQYINVWQPSVIGENLDENSVNWCAMGDSITYGYYSFMSGSSAQNTQHRSYGWAQIVAEMKNWNATNLGVGGTGYVRGSFTATGQKSAPRIVHDTDFTPYDIVTLAYGVNDWKGNRSLGSMADTPLTDAEIEAAESGVEIGNLYRNMKYVIEKIMSSNPNCKIVVITPINCGAYGDISTNWGIGYDLEYSGSLEDVFSAEKEICEYYGISYIDMTHSSVVNRLNMMTACLDGVHPTIRTHRTMAHEIAARIGYR